MNAVEKIIAAHCGQRTVRPGQIVEADLDWVMANDATTSLAIQVFSDELQAERVFDPDKVVLVMDHYTPSSSVDAANTHNRMRRFARQQGLRHVHDGSGICHQLMLEQHVAPGQLCIGADSHTCTYGAIGALATGMGSTDIAVAWRQGKIWLKVPESIRITVSGKWPEQVGAKDLILRIIGDLTADGATYRALCFTGPAISALSVSGRMTLCNMAIEAGAKFAYIEPDARVAEFMRGTGRTEYTIFRDDDNAWYEREIRYDVSTLAPQIACPHSVDNVREITDCCGIEINEIFLGACTNGRYEDLALAAVILRGKKIAAGVRLLVAPASRQVLLEAMADEVIANLVESGAMIANPGCSACFGGCGGILGKGEKLLTTANRNFRARVGSPDSEIYLASPTVAAASALTGRITDPRRREI